VLTHRIEMLAAACVLIRACLTHKVEPAPGRLASFEAWDDLVRQTVAWADKALDPGALGDPMDLVREAQAADPEADALFSLLDALRDRFMTEFSAKDVLSAVSNCTIRPGPIETALTDLAGDMAARSAKSLGRVLKFREGRIVHGLRLTGRQDKASGSRFYRVVPVEPERVAPMKPEKNGFNGFNGFLSSHTEKGAPPPEYKGGENNPSNPLNPVDAALDDPFNPDAWR
jgi:hypothetical protein